jgi:HAMP domain-containing protein
MDRGQPCLNISGGYVFRDYRGEAENTNLVTMVVPVFRNGQVIGCVGEGLLIDKIILGEDIIPRAVSALFLGNGILRYSGNSAYAGNSLEQMGFANHRLIMEALSRGKELFLSDTPSPLLGERAYAFFLPVYLRDFNELVYIYTALPRDVISEAIAPVLRPIIICAIIALASFFALLFYFYETLAKPIRGLTLAGEAIARGDLNREIIVSKSNDEIGVMSRSLRDMVEQFRMYIALEEQSTKLLELHMRIQNALYTSDTLNDAFDSIAPIICDALDAYKGSIIILIKGMPRVRVVYRTAAGPEDSGQDMDFKYHNHVASLLSGRKYLLCNAGGISENKIEFTDEDTTALCVIPILIEGSLRGYILLEGRGESGLSVHDDSTLCFIADTIAYILARRGISEEPIRLRDDTRTGELDQRDSIA